MASADVLREARMDRPTNRLTPAAAEVLREFTRPRMLEDFAPSSCIAATRIVLSVAEYLGLPARAVLAAALVCNAPFAEVLTAEGLDAAVQRQQTDTRLWSVGISGDAEPGVSVGHLVADVGGDLVDLAIDQANRPHRSIEAHPVVVPMLGGHPAGLLAAATFTNGTSAMWWKDPADAGLWRRSNNFDRKHPAIRAIVGETIRAIRAAS